MNKLIIILALVAMVLGVQAQRPGGGNYNPADMPKDGILTGKVVDADTQQPVEYANVVLYSMRDSSLVTGALSDASGNFEMKELPYGRYYVVANFIGYEKNSKSDIRINPKQKEQNLGSIGLAQANVEIDEVNVIADRAHIEYKIDKKVVNVSQDITAAGGMAIDVLENTPSIQVDLEGNITMRGSSNFTVLIDGKPSVLDAADILQQIPASSIENIEIITNPSAKYDPDGVGGIINVVMKKQKRAGINGIVNASIGNNNRYSGDFLLQYRGDKFGISGGLDYRMGGFEGNTNSQREATIGDTIEHIDMLGDRNMTRSGYGGKIGLDFYPTKSTTITMEGRMGIMGFERAALSKYHTYSNPVTDNLYYLSNNVFDMTRQYYSANTFIQQKFADEGHEISARLHLSGNEGDRDESQERFMTDLNYDMIDYDPWRYQSLQADVSTNFRAQIDYVKPLQGGKIEAGIQTRITDENTDYNFEDYISGNWVNNPLYSNQMEMQQQIHSAYTTLSNSFAGFDYQLGLRGEYYNRNISLPEIKTEYPFELIDFFPSVHVSRKLGKTMQAQASYSRRVNRPRERDLNPFPAFSDGFTTRVGNPELLPEYTNSMELNLQKRFGSSFVSVETYYRETNNKISRVQSLNDDGLVEMTVANLNRDYAMGSEIMTNLELKRWWRFVLTGNIYYYYVDGQITDQDEVQSSTNFDMRLNNTFSFTPITKLQITAFYRGPSATAQGEMEGFLYTNVAVKHEFFDRKLSATLQVRDLLGTAKHKYTVNSENLVSVNEFHRESQMVSLSLSYKINNYKQKRQRGMEGGGGGDDMDIDIMD